MKNKTFFNELNELDPKKRKDIKETFESALTAAYKKNFNEASDAIFEMDENTFTIKCYKCKVVVDVVTDPEKEISLAEAKAKKRTYKLGDIVKEEVAPKDFSRIAVQTAKQVVMQKMREIEKEETKNEMKEKLDKLLSTHITRIDRENGNVYVKLNDGILEGVMGKYDQIPGETYRQNDAIKVYVKELKETPKGGPVVHVTRTSPLFVKKLLEFTIPEIASGDLEVYKVAREAGLRTKVAIKCNNDQTDPVGACIGPHSTRINSIISELNGEKVDIVIYSEDPVTYIERALSPATVERIVEEDGVYTAYVPNQKLSLAIGKNGVNVKLAARLTDLKINIVESEDYADMMEDSQIVSDDPVGITEDIYGTDDDTDDGMDIDNLFSDEE